MNSDTNEMVPEIENKDGSTLMLVPAGEFQMGITEEEAGRLVEQYGWRPDRVATESPQHTVYLDSFYLSKYPVTVSQYSRFVEETGANSPTCSDDPRFTIPSQPVVGVEYGEAIAYAEWAGLRLPTEAEWEKAARGDDQRRWPWGNEWHPEKLNSAETGRGQPPPVGAFDEAGNVSPYGICDMVGNVWEWCLDRVDDGFYSESPRENPLSRRPGNDIWEGQFMLRGGSWYNNADRCRCTSRFDRYGQMARRHVGFRCAMSAPGTPNREGVKPIPPWSAGNPRNSPMPMPTTPPVWPPPESLSWI